MSSDAECQTVATPTMLEHRSLALFQTEHDSLSL